MTYHTFNPMTTNQNTLPVNEFVSIWIFDVRCNNVANLVNTKKYTGNHNIIFDGSNLASGLYYYRIDVGNFSATRKMV